MGASDEPLRISIELDPRAEPLAGTVSVPGAEPRTFLGWMELAHTIDLARVSRADADDDGGGSRGGETPS
jgi:hypothetical protein